MSRLRIPLFLALVGLSVGIWADTITLHPTGQGYSNQGTPVPAGAGTNWDRVNDQTGNAATGAPVADDGDTSYVNMANNNWVDSYALAVSNIPSGSTVTGLDVYATARGASAQPCSFQVFYRFNATNTVSGTFTRTSTTYSSSNNAWTGLTLDETAWSGLEIGVIAIDANPDVYVTQVYAVITYTPPVPTTTVGNGLTAEPTDSTLCPGHAIADLDNFTLKTNMGTDTVTALTVTLGPPGAFNNIGSVTITNDAGTTTYGTVNNPASTTVTFSSFSPNISINSTETQYRVRITPKSHAAMPAVPGASYATTGTVTAITCTNATKVYNDLTSGTLTIDNDSPAAASFSGCNGSSASQIDLTFTNPETGVLVVRGPAGGTCPTFAPVEGDDTYSPGAQGADTIVFAGAGTSFSDTGLAASTTYCYEIWAYDGCWNYAQNPGTTSCATQAPAATTTVGNGTNPGNTTICPGGSATMLDAFTLQTSAGTDTVTAATVTFAAGTAASLSLVEITSDDGLTVYGSVANPASDAPAVALPSNITATTTQTQYKVRITPKTHAALGGPPGSSYAVTGTVTAIASGNAKTYGDSTSATVTVDDLAPADATWGAVTPGDNQLTLGWTNPVGDFAQVVVIRNTTTPVPGTPTEGASYSVPGTLSGSTIVYVGSGTSFVDTGVLNGSSYYYKVFTKDACGSYAAGVQTGPHIPGATANNKVRPGVPSAVVDGCAQITVRMPFADDDNANSTVTVKRGTAAAGPFGTTVCTGVVGASPRTCVDSTAAGSTTYYYEITFADADGVIGTNPQVIGPYTTPACTAGGTTITSNTAVLSSCRQITVTSIFTGDGDGDGSTKVEYNTTNTWPGTTSCGAVSGPSPRQCIVTGLSPSTQYYVRVTFTDPDGVTGTNPQVVGPFTTAACGADQVAPTLTVQTPAEGAIIGGAEKFKVQVFDETSAISTLTYSVNGGASTPFLAGLNGNYLCGTGCGVYEFTLDTVALGLSNGPHYVRIQAVDAAGNEARLNWTFTVNNRGGKAAGSGTLLRRAAGSQSCIDCHNIKSHSSQHTSTTYGNWALDCLTCHTPHRTTNIYVVRNSVRTPNSGSKTVTFRADDRSGGTNPQNSYLGAYDAGGAPYDDGICEACHTRTNYYRNDASGANNHNHNQGARCVDCHKHDEGFKGAGCNGCHNAPPNKGKHGSHWQDLAVVGSSYTDTASQTTATQYIFACAKCHSGTHLDDTHAGTLADPYQVQVLFDAVADPKNAAGTYAAGVAQPADLGPGGKYWSWSDGTCSNLYCHSRANPLGGTDAFAAVTWNQATAVTCTSCHQGAGAATMLSPAHRLHTDSAKYGYGCVRCHTATVSDNTTVSDKRQHVDGQKDVLFDASGVNNGAGTYDGGAYTCSNTYCHSNGQDRVAPYTSGPSVAWNSTATCRSCHAGNAAASPTMASGRHTPHVNNLTSGGGVLGVNYACASCHNATVGLASDTAITGWASHVDGDPDVSMTTGSYAAPSCTNNYCHSSGQATPEFYSMSWAGAAIDCKGCHGRHSTNAFTSQFGEPNYSNGGASTATANSHQKHVSSATDCADCHNDTTATGAAILNGYAGHTDGTRQVAIAVVWDTNGGTKTDNYTAGTKTCASIKCHGAGTPVWGGIVYCIGCHGGAADSNNWVINDGTASVISTTEWTTVGHGKAAVGLGGANPCLYCHADGVNHGVGTNPFRLNGATVDAVALPGSFNAATKNGNDACLNCHGTGSFGVDPDGASAGYAKKTSTKKIDSWHHGAKHSATQDGGMRCWDCHDAHGDASNIQMVGSDVLSDSADVYGLTGTRPATAVAFTANGVGSDFAKTGAPFNGVCNVCHTTTAHYTNATGDGHFGGSGCTASCHRHDQAAPTDAFKPKTLCNECHNAPPGATAGRHAKHYEIATVPTSYTDLTAGTTATQYGYACAKCHTGTHFNDWAHAGTAANPYQTQVVFDTTQAPANAGGTYAQLYNDATDAGADPIQFYSWTDDTSGANGVCANLYCHSNAAPVGGTDSRKTVYWNQAAGSVTCSSCHSTAARSDTGNTLTNLSNAHGVHIQSASGETGTYSFKCDECHAQVVVDNPANPWLLTGADLGDKRNHVTGTHTVNFSSTSIVSNINQSGGAYNGGTYTCTGTYCHSGGVATSAPFSNTASPAVTWNGSATCRSCHGWDAAAAPTIGVIAGSTFRGSANHAGHIANAAVIGTNYVCADCHNSVVASGNSPITDRTRHVNGTKELAIAPRGPYTSSDTTPNCSNTYCHSSGQATPVYVPILWSAAAIGCNGCHGTGNALGRPDYANGGAGTPTANSHQAHVSAAADCAVCHQSTTTNGISIASGSTLHTDGSRQVTWDAAHAGATYTQATKSCSGTGSACHGAGTPQWGGAVTCRSCHMGTGAGDQDVDNWVYGNGTIATLDGEDWYAYGHGATAAFTESGNSAPNFDSGNPGTRDGCLYCHTAGVGHNVAANPFRLANIGAGNTVALKNGVCTVCHGGAGYNPGSGLIDAPDNIDAWHYGAAHSSTGDGGLFCWDCHDPHGDYNYGVTQRLAYMIDETPTQDHSGSAGWGMPTTLAPTPDFRFNRDGAGSSGVFSWGDYVSNALVSGTYRGVCQVCHTSTAVSHFRQTVYNATHNNTGRCTTSCHTHDQPSADAFKPAGGDCKGCHGARTGTIPRAQIVGGTAGNEGDDFIRASRHVSNGTTTSIVTNFDCILCHTEGDVTSTSTDMKTLASAHGADGGTTTVDLRNVDSSGGTGVMVAWSGKRLASFTASTAQRDAMDSFCMGCHDANGASRITVNATDSGMDAGTTDRTRRLTPFNTADNLQNARETWAALKTSRTRVTNVRDQFNSGNATGKNWASHHNLNQFTKRYSTRNTTYWPNAAWTTYTTKEGQNIQTAGEIAGLHCSDCHLNEMNAHGSSNSWYMLSDSSGADAAFTNSGLPASTDICSKCHAASAYGEAGADSSTASRTDAHDGDCTRIDGPTVYSNRGASLGYGSASPHQIACLMCHGGLEPGMIHGTNATYNPWKSATWTSKRYRFMGTGGSMRWYSPNATATGDDTSWEGTASFGCYTVSAADTYGACTQHGSGRSSFPSNRARPLEY